MGNERPPVAKSDGHRHAVVIGGGAAGYFAAITAAERYPDWRVTILEASQRVLAKVKVSGGGRCNVTHQCFEPELLVRNYPRGARELRGAFSRFQPRDTIKWFASRGVTLKAEVDGRIFPATNTSATIIDCLEQAAAAAGVEVRCGAKVAAIEALPPGETVGFNVHVKSGECLRAARVLLATGGGTEGHTLATLLGHRLSPPVPSLFTFKIVDPRISGLSGLTIAEVKIALRCAGQTSWSSYVGPLLITHWGWSGPAVLKLSAFAARDLAASAYQGDLRLSLLPDHDLDMIRTNIVQYREAHPRLTIAKHSPFEKAIPRRLWDRLVTASGIKESQIYADLPRPLMQALAAQIHDGIYTLSGKGVFKDEFVTAGGVVLGDIDFRTMASKIRPGLFFAGELLDIDGITGGFNFQAAWTTGWIAGQNLGASLEGSLAN